jgi:phosphinothricin acetyltransferase
MLIREAVADDAAAIVSIYNHFILNTIITFEEQAITDAEMAQRIADVQSSDLPWLVLEQSGVVVGYAYATKWRARHAYRFSVESTVYLAPEFAGRGLGTALYSELIRRLDDKGCHLVIGGIALPNVGSVALHEKMGFEKENTWELEIGKKELMGGVSC